MASAVGVTGASTGTAEAATTRHGITFDRVVDVVDDLGLDPSGNTPVQGALHGANQEGTLFVFPEGEYLITERLLIMNNDAVGILGEGNARFVVPENYNDEALIVDRGQRFLFENMDLDLRASGATPGLKFGAHDRGEVHDVELIGQGIHPNSDPRGGNDPGVATALYLIARNANANILVENFVAKNDGLMGAYNHGDGRNGVWVGRTNKGTVTVRNCHFSGFPNNGLYTSRTPGVVQVEGGVFRNNDISQIRLGSEGSYVQGAFIEVDPNDSRSPNPEDMLNGRGVRIESGPIHTGGVTVRDCDIRIAEGASSEGGVVVGSSGGKFDVLDTRISVNNSRGHGVKAKRPASGDYAPPWPRRGLLRNVSITGSADHAQAVQLVERRDSVIDSCCIEQTGSGRRAFRLIDSGGTVVKNSTLDVTAGRFDLRGMSIDEWGNATSGSCPVPQRGGGSTAGSGDGGDGRGTTGDGGGERTLSFTAPGDPVAYSVEVSGKLQPTDSIDTEDGMSSSSASGWVSGGWDDTYRYTGQIERVVVKGAVRFVYDRSTQRIVIDDNDTGQAVSYEVVTGDKLWLTDQTGDQDAPESAGAGERARGSVGKWRDEFGCTGDLVSADVDGVFAVNTSGN